MEYGTFELTMEAMKKHISDANVCCSGCSVLWNVTLHNGKHSPSRSRYPSLTLGFICEKQNSLPPPLDDTQNKAVEQGVIEAVFDVMKTHIKNKDVCINVYYVLRMIINKNGTYIPIHRNNNIIYI